MEREGREKDKKNSYLSQHGSQEVPIEKTAKNHRKIEGKHFELYDIKIEKTDNKIKCNIKTF